jgi:rSAM/selenodomain-associated transferase 2
VKFSVIIPVWNEGRQISAALRRLRQISDNEHMELILVDGGSKDDTVDTARRWADRIEVLDSPNRGKQLAAGAKVATGDLLFFLHADTQPPGDWQRTLERFWLAAHKTTPSATVFSVDYGRRWDYRLVAWGQNRRVDWRQVAYGDAGFCLPRENYDAAGGLPEHPLMEDVAFSKKLTKIGPIVRLPHHIHPGARRLHKIGPLRNSLRNFWLRLQYACGVSPEKLWKKYYSVRAEEGIGLADGEKALHAAARQRLERARRSDPLKLKKKKKTSV